MADDFVARPSVAAGRRAPSGAAAGAALVLLAALAGPAAAVAPAPDTASRQAVRAEAATAVPIVEPLTATGTIEAWRTVVVGAHLSGIAVIEVLVDEGDDVAAGDLIARLDDRAAAAQVTKQTAVLAAKQAGLEQAIASETRGDKLLTSNAVSTEEAENRRIATRTARAELAEAEAELERLRIALADTRITAPVAGRVAAKPIAVGTTVSEGTEIARIIEDGRLEVAAEVDERHLGRIAGGAAVAVGASDGRSVAGTVRTVAETVDPLTRLGAVYVALPADAGLRAGMSAHVAFSLAATDSITVPEAALVWRNAEPAVFVVDDAGRATLRPIETGARAGGRVAVAGGLADGERVVTAGAAFLNDGDAVRVVTETADAGAIDAVAGPLPR